MLKERLSELFCALLCTTVVDSHTYMSSCCRWTSHCWCRLIVSLLWRDRPLMVTGGQCGWLWETVTDVLRCLELDWVWGFLIMTQHMTESDACWRWCRSASVLCHGPLDCVVLYTVTCIWSVHNGRLRREDTRKWLAILITAAPYCYQWPTVISKYGVLVYLASLASAWKFLAARTH